MYMYTQAQEHVPLQAFNKESYKYFAQKSMFKKYTTAKKVFFSKEIYTFIQQVYIKLIKSNSKDICKSTKDFNFK